MMFLLRLMFWLLVICLLLPGQHVDNQRLMSSASKTVADMQGFCGRNPDVCADVKGMARSVLISLKTGAETVEGWVAQPPRNSDQSWPAPYRTPQRPAPNDYGGYNGYERARTPQNESWTPPRQPTPQWRNSLNANDRDMPWRGPNG